MNGIKITSHKTKGTPCSASYLKNLKYSITWCLFDSVIRLEDNAEHPSLSFRYIGPHLFRPYFKNHHREKSLHSFPSLEVLPSITPHQVLVLLIALFPSSNGFQLSLFHTVIYSFGSRGFCLLLIYDKWATYSWTTNDAANVDLMAWSQLFILDNICNA